MSQALIIVSGPPASGKTTIARRIAETFQLPCVHKDAIKECLFDALGWKDRDWSRKLGLATYQILFYFLEVQLSAGKSTVVESNFRREESTEPFRRLLAGNEFYPIQVMCWAAGETLIRRFRNRDVNGERHPGHVDVSTIDEVAAELLLGRYEPLDIEGDVIEVETTDFEAIEFDALLGSVGVVLEPAKASRFGP